MAPYSTAKGLPGNNYFNVAKRAGGGEIRWAGEGSNSHRLLLRAGRGESPNLMGEYCYGVHHSLVSKRGRRQRSVWVIPIPTYEDGRGGAKLDERSAV